MACSPPITPLLFSLAPSAPTPASPPTGDPILIGNSPFSIPTPPTFGPFASAPFAPTSAPAKLGTPNPVTVVDSGSVSADLTSQTRTVQSAAPLTSSALSAENARLFTVAV